MEPEPKRRVPPARQTIFKGLELIVFFSGLAACASKGLAQGVLAPPPSDFSGLPPQLQTTGTNEPGKMVFPTAGPVAAPEKPLLGFDQVEFHPHLLYRFMYGDGIQSVPGAQSKTVINELYPGMLLRLGPHWSLDYTPALSFYSNNRFQDTVDHSVTLSGGTIYRDWALGLSQSYAISTQPLIQTGAQTEQQTYSTGLSAACQLSSAVSLDLGLNQNFDFVGQGAPGQQLADTRSWSTTDWLNYRFSPIISAGIGATFGYDNVEATNSPDMTHEQLMGRVDFIAGQKLTLSVSGGAEDRQFLDSNVPNEITPIFGASAHYALFESTVLELSANRSVSPALFASQTIESTTVSGGINQRFFGKLHAEVNGGYVTSSYSTTAVGQVVNRQDDGVFANVRLSIRFLKRGTASAFYQYSRNSSNQAGFAYSSSQEGFELGCQF